MSKTTAPIRFQLAVAWKNKGGHALLKLVRQEVLALKPRLKTSLSLHHKPYPFWALYVYFPKGTVTKQIGDLNVLSTRLKRRLEEKLKINPLT